MTQPCDLLRWIDAGVASNEMDWHIHFGNVDEAATYW